MRKNWKRILAVMLAASMIFGNSAPAYATESQPVVEVVEGETEVAEVETMVEGPAEEIVSETMQEIGEEEEIRVQEVVTEVNTVNTYNSSEYLSDTDTEGWRIYNRTSGGTHYLIIYFKDAVPTDLSEVLSAIADCKTAMLAEVEGNGTAYNSVRIEVQCSNETSKTVSKKLWNTVVDYSQSAEASNKETWFMFMDSDGMEYKWLFSEPKQVTEDDVPINMAYSVSIAEDNVTVSFDNTAFPVNDTSVFVETNSLRGSEAIGYLKEYFGNTEQELELWKENASAKEKNFAKYFYESYPDEESGESVEIVTLRIDSVDELSAGTYELKKYDETTVDEEKSYEVSVREQDGKNILVIDCASHDDYNAFETDVVTELKSQTTKYDGVEITYLNPEVTNYSDDVAKEVWNAAVALLNTPEEGEEVSLSFNRVFENTDITDEEGTYTANSNWHIPNPVEVTEDISFEIAYDSETHTLTTGDINFPKNTDAYWNLWTPVNCDDYIAKFGDSADEITLELCKNSTSVGVEAYYCVNYDEADAFEKSISLYAINVGALEAKTAYTLQQKIYKGTVDEWDDGSLALNINPGDARKDSLTDAEVEAILAYHNEGTFREITIEQNDGEFQISKSLANTAGKYLAEPEEGIASELRFGFWDDSAKVYYQWGIVNPGTQTANQKVSLEYSVEEGKAPTVKLGSQTLVGEDVFAHINVNTENNPDYYEWTIDSLGSGEKDIILEGVDAGGWYNYDKWSAWMDIRNVGNTEAGKVYNIIPKPYTGNVDYIGNGRRKLTLSPFDAGKEEAFTLEELQAIVATHINNLDAYEFVEYIIPISDNNVIKADFAEELIKILLDYDDYSEFLCFTFEGDGYSYVVGLLEPEMQPTDGKDVTVDFGITFDATNKKISHKQSGMKLNAETGVIGYNYVPNSGLGKQLYECFGGSFDYWYPFTEADDSTIESYYVAQEDNIYFEIDSDDLFDGAEKEYEFTKASYRGVEEQWDNGVRALAFYPSDLENYGLVFSEETIENILEDVTNAEESYDAIVVQYPEIPDSVSVDLWNQAVNTLSDHEEKCIQLRFSGGDTYDINWHFGSPETTESLNLGVDFVIGEEGKYGTVKFAETEIPASYAEVSFVSEENNEEGKTDFDKFRAAFANESMIGLNILDSAGKCNINAEAVYTAEDSEDGYSNAVLCIQNVAALESEKVYTLEMSQYRGDVEGDDDWRSLFLTSYAFGKEKLDPADFEEIVAFYEKNDNKFDVIEFEQAAGKSNIIDKDLINLARKILRTDEESESDRRVTFIFCDCGETEDGEWIQNDLNWSFMNPGEATKDINANITMSAAADYGVTVKFSANTYNADNVFAQYFVTPDSEMANAFDAAVASDGKWMLLKNAADVVNSEDIWYGYNEGANAKEFFIGNIQNLEAKTSYLICDINDADEVYVVGENVSFEITKPVDAGKKVTWKVHSPQSTEVDKEGNVSFINDSGEHYISAQYVSGGKTVFDFWRAEAYTRLDKISFKNAEYQVEFWPDNDDEYANRGYLDVRYYPSNAGMDPADLKWEIVDENGNPVETDVIKFIESEDDGRIRGEIKGLKEGTAIVKVTHSNEENSITATCTVKVVEAADYIPSEEWEKVGDLYAFANADKTLADIELPDGWSWVNPKQSLKNYYDTYGHDFEAIYNKNGQEIRTTIRVNMITITSFSVDTLGLDEDGNVIAVEAPKSLQIGEEIVWGFAVETKGDFNKFIDAMNGRFILVASDNLESTDKDSIVGEDVEDCRMFTAVKKGNHKFSASIRDTYTGKDIAKVNWSIKVYEKLFDFDKLIVDVEGSNESFTEGKLHMYIPADAGVKITSVKVSDKKVLSIGKPVVEPEYVSFEENQHEGVDSDTQYVDTWVTFKDGTPGQTQLIITVNDDAKSTHTRIFRTREKEPKLLQTSFQINKAYDYNLAMCNIQFADYYPYAKDDEENRKIEVTGTYSKLFNYIEDTGLSNYESGRIIGSLQLKNDSVQNGTYNVQLKIPVDRSEDGGTVENYITTVKVKVISKEPTVKIKQTAKVNTFYKQSVDSTEGCGTLTFDIGNLSWAGEIKLLEGNDFTIISEGDGIVKVLYTPNDDEVIEKDLKFELKLVDDINGYITLEKTVKIQTEDKAPTIVPSAKTNTVYPKYGATFVPVRLTDKATGEEISTFETSVLLNKKTGEILKFTEKEDEYAKVTMSKNTVYVGRETPDDNIIYFVVDNERAVDSTEKFTINVQEENWSRPVTFNYTLKVATKAPKLQLGTSTLSLNVNKEVRDSQVARTSLNFANCSIALWENVYFTGTDEKSKAVLNKGLSLEYDYERREIVARFNVSEADDDYQVPKGTYSFKVWASNWAYNSSAALKIKVADKAPEKCIKLTKKGSIDVLLHESTSITYAPKLSGLSGKVINAWLDGQDAYMFDTYYEDGKLVVKANADNTRDEGFNTKHSYKVTPVFEVENPYGEGRYSVCAAEQSVKVSQGKPKVTVTSYNGNTIYSLAGNELKFYMDAALKNEDVAIEHVELLNYTEDISCEYNPENQQIILRRQQPKQITVNGKTWALKFAVTFLDSAGNEKPVQVTYKVTIK